MIVSVIMVMVMLALALPLPFRPSNRSRCAVVWLAIGIARVAARRFVPRRLVGGMRFVVDAAHCGGKSQNITPRELFHVGSLPFEDFLPMPSLSITFSAHWICLVSTRSALSMRIGEEDCVVVCVWVRVCEAMPVGAPERLREG